jgi:photosystem II stability/assembly factor-like uncharacterized protein
VTATPGDPYPLGTPVTPSATIGPSPTRTPTPTTTATATSTPIAWSSPLVVDSAAGRIYASMNEGGAARLLIYATRDGRLIDQRPLEAGEVLLDVDPTGRLYVYRPDRGLRVLDAGGGMATGGVLELPTPDPADSLQGRPIIVGPIEPLKPLVHPVTGELLTFHGMTATLHDPESGQVTRQLEVPLPGEAGPIYRADVTDDGQLLYLAVADEDLHDWEGQPGTILLALDLTSGAIVERRDKHALATRWLGWGSDLLATFEVHKDIGYRHSLWIDGHEEREVFESGIQWRAYDTRRDWLLGVPYSELGEIALAEADTLNVRALIRPPVSQTSEAYTSNTYQQPIAYDADTDQLFARTHTIDRLHVIPADEIQPAPTPAAADDATPQVEFRSGGIMRSVDGGATWTPASDGINALFIMDLIVSPDFEHDRTLFATSFRGMQSSGDAGYTTTWRSQNGGDDWEPVGTLAALAFSPDFARDRTVMAFDYLDTQFQVSTDGGDTWTPRGRLPQINYDEDVATRLWVIPATAERSPILLALGNDDTQMGGGPHWPESGARVFRSTDGGWTWELAWGDTKNFWGAVSAWNPELIGPVPVGQPGGPAEPAWLLHLGSECESCATLISRDGGQSWDQTHVAEDPKAYPVAVRPDGKVVVKPQYPAPERAVPLDAFVPGPPPTPTPRTTPTPTR